MCTCRAGERASYQSTRVNGGTTHEDEEYNGKLMGQWLCSLWASGYACIFGVQGWKQVVSLKLTQTREFTKVGTFDQREHRESKEKWTRDRK